MAQAAPDSRYPEPRRVEISTADVLGLTVLEWARVSVVADVARERLAGLTRLAVTNTGEPAEIEAAARVVYAIALMLERRLDPAISWDEAQTWRVVMRRAPAEAALIEAEAEAEVSAAILTGTPVEPRAGALRIAHVAAYGKAHEAQRKAAKRHRRGA
jgi:hypothetical protein